MKIYSVWVGGGEINSHYLTKEEAETLAAIWKQKGYTDTAIEEVAL